MNKLTALLSMIPASVGNHTNYSGGTHTGGSFSGRSGGSHGGFFFVGGGSGSGSGGSIITAIIIVAVIILVFYLLKKYKNVMPNTAAPSEPASFNRDDEITQRVKAHDPDFSREHFLSWSEQVFVQLQQAWSERDWKKARPFESEELFNLHKSQLDDFIRNGTINVMENVCVNESYLCDYVCEEKYEFLTVFMKTRYNDYIIKEETKEVIKGDPNRTYNVDYKLKFMRSVGVMTGEFSNKSTHNCPNCGAPVDVNAAGQCAYCGTVITDGEHDWVLCNLDDVNQY
ncbi:MAG TPA: Tim44 domain-containing protein [Ruminiclostridium sp.]|nr:Tim44 domain-containing protein [Ruminiclostridium sp.]